MFLKKYLVDCRKEAGTAAAADLESLLSVAEMKRMLQRERARVDRNGSQFSLIAMTPREPERAHATLAQLATLLRRRLRCTDEVGWLEEQQIGVFLPDTPASGAWKVADDICLAFSTDEHPPLCMVYQYPSEPGTEDEMPLRAEEPAFDRPVVGLQVFFARPMPLWKRCLDATGAGLGLLLLSPLMVLVALAVKLTSPGPVFFRQWRAGLGGRAFQMIKFRSMRVDAEACKAALMRFNEQDGPAFKIRNDPRVTPIGRLIRSTSIDELPQLWNVLVGEMSLVGPRPLPCHESNGCSPWQRQRLDVTPGLTCIWQVRGRSSVSFDEWMRMDIRYLWSRSIVEDLRLLVQTIPAVILRKGAS